jgi:hypothetical protein
MNIFNTYLFLKVTLISLCPTLTTTTTPTTTKITSTTIEAIMNVNISNIKALISIQNANLKILEPVSPTQNNIYLYNKSIDFIIDMSFGANIIVELFTGEEELIHTLPISRFIPDIWSSPLTITKKYRYPGDYKVTAIISNSVSSIILTKQITVMSSVSGLIVELKNSPVIYFHQSTKDYGRAYFQFKYEGLTCAASHANISFTVGDSTFTYGPFWLGMDFFQNISKTPFFHDYSSVGNYSAVFTVQNAVSSMVLTLSILVAKAIYGVHLLVIPPYCLTGTATIEQAFIEQGDNVTLEWSIDNNHIGTYKEIS